MFRGLATISYFAADVEAATAWYTELLGIEPYFVREYDGRPAYVEFRIGDYEHELGLIDARFTPHQQVAGPSGAVMYWHVDDVAAAHTRLLSLGATEHEPVIERGEGFVTASAVDPFGNVVGIMQNPHYLQVVGATGRFTADA